MDENHQPFPFYLAHFLYVCLHVGIDMRSSVSNGQFMLCLFQISLQNHAPHVLMQLPLLLRWYHRVQDVPGVRRAAENCGIALFRPQVPQPCSTQAYTPHCLESEQESPAPPQERFVGGPRPTLTKLQVIQRNFPHFCFLFLYSTALAVC